MLDTHKQKLPRDLVWPSSG